MTLGSKRKCPDKTGDPLQKGKFIWKKESVIRMGFTMPVSIVGVRKFSAYHTLRFCK